jgi:hypothetical protein
MILGSRTECAIDAELQLTPNFGKSADSTSDIQPIELCRQLRPPQKIPGDEPAPTIHVGLAELAGSPCALALIWHDDFSVLPENEVRALFAQLEGTRWLATSLLYGTGMRLLEGLRLRIDRRRRRYFLRNPSSSTSLPQRTTSSCT